MSATAKLSLYDYPPRPEPEPALAPAPPTADARIAALESEVKELWAFLKTIRPPENLPHERERLVTLDQCAGMCHRSKRGLEKYRDRMPEPDVPGGGGRPNLWAWSKIRPFLERTFHQVLPEKYPC